MTGLLGGTALRHRCSDGCEQLARELRKLASRGETSRRLFARTVGAAALAMAAPCISWSADAAGATPPAASIAAPAQPQEVVVTARRRGETISKTPLAITAITGQQLVAAGVTSVNQIQYLVPGLVVSRGVQGVELTLRGVSTTDFSTKNQPDINYNTDGIPTLRAQEQSLGFFDISRVEVVAGPQSTLYGESSTGGVVNVVTNAPTFTPDGSVTVEAGNYATKRAQVMINVPVNDWLAIRAAVDANYRDGYVHLIGQGSDASPNDEQNITGRFSALAKLDDLTLRFIYTGGVVKGVGFTQSLPININASLVGSGTDTGFANNFRGKEDDRWQTPSLQADYALGPVHLTNIASYNFYSYHQLAPNYNYGGQGNRTLGQNHFNTYFDEFRASNQDPSERLQYVLGGNFMYEHIWENGHGWVEDPDAPAPLDPQYVDALNALNNTQHNAFSGFAHGIFAIAPTLHFTAGVREAFDRVSRDGTFAFGTGFGSLWPNYAGTPCVGTQDCVGTPDSATVKSHSFTYNVGLDYQLTPGQMVYATVASGYKPGSFNDFVPSVGGPAPYGPEKLTAYEAGYKARLPWGLQFTTALYYYDYSAEQITEVVFINGDRNAGNAYTVLAPTRELGLENALAYAITPLDIVNLGANIARATYASGNGLLTGKSLDNVAPFVGTAGYAHTWTLPSGASVKLHGETRFSASYVTNDASNLVQYRQSPFTRSDADLTFTTADGRYISQLFVTNMENKTQFNSDASGYIVGVPLSASATTTEPRFFGFRQTVKF